MSSFALSNVYNNYLTAYTPKSSRYDTHKKDELKSVYKAIVKQSEDSPLFLPDRTGRSQSYAVSLKEDARELKNTIASLSSDFSSSVLDKKVASSSNEDIVQAKYIGTNDTIDSAPSFEIEVEELASPQVNIGNFLPNKGLSIPPDVYSFDIHVNDTDYEFQFTIDEEDTNRQIEERISRLVARANIGIEAAVIDGEDDTSALKLSSTTTGKRADGRLNFVITDDHTSKRQGAVDYFGLAELSHEPTNASFKVNGNSHTAFSNIFTIDKTYELNLRGVTKEDDAPVKIGLKADVDALTENINHLAGAYNDFMRRASEYSQNYGRSNKFMREMVNLTGRFSNALDAVGLYMQKDGTLTVDQTMLTETAKENDSRASLSAVQDFTDALINKSNEVSLNPMQYTQQVVVAYKGPGPNFPNPYMTSPYSGMMFSSYC